MRTMTTLNGYELYVEYIHWAETHATMNHDGEAAYTEAKVIAAWNPQGRQLTSKEVNSVICSHELAKHIEQSIMNGR